MECDRLLGHGTHADVYLAAELVSRLVPISP